MSNNKSLTTVLTALASLTPYDNNPRDNSDAIESVAASIQEFGFLVPIVADSKGVIAAGHTRYLAAQRLGLEEVPVVTADHLTEAQLNAFRLVDNKVSELAEWDFDKLAGEIAGLKDVGVELTPFGWTQEEIDCLSDMVADDCLENEMPEQDADGVNAAVEASQGVNVLTKDSASIRIAVGQFNFYIPKEDFEEWSDKIRKDNKYDNDAVLTAIANKLGLGKGHKNYKDKQKSKKTKELQEKLSSTPNKEPEQKQPRKRVRNK